MAGRKQWADLTPAYRRRLESKGIGPETHATANLRTVRGHGLHLPSHTGERVKREMRWRDRLQTRESKLGYVKPTALDMAIAELGFKPVEALIAYQEYKHAIYRYNRRENASPANGYTSLEAFVIAEYGEDVWDSMSEWVAENYFTNGWYYYQ